MLGVGGRELMVSKEEEVMLSENKDDSVNSDDSLSGKPGEWVMSISLAVLSSKSTLFSLLLMSL